MDELFDSRSKLMTKSLNYKTDDQFIQDKKMEPAAWIDDNRNKKPDNLMLNSTFYKQIQEKHEHRKSFRDKQIESNPDCINIKVVTDDESPLKD